MASKVGPPTDSPSANNGSDSADLDSARAAVGGRRSPRAAPAGDAAEAAQRSARSNRRATLGLVLVGLVLAAALDLATSTSTSAPRAGPDGDSRAATVFSNAESGTCLDWPTDEPDKPSFVQCSADHMFEVAKTVDMSNFAEPCQMAVREYLGPRYDPSSKFTIGVLWAGDADEIPAPDRRLLCGLQLIGVGGKPTPFTGQIAELDQSKVWPAGTCLGADPAPTRPKTQPKTGPTTQPTDTPVDCSEPHAAEVTGSVGLAERFPGGPPTEADQDAFVREECTRLTDAYLGPGGLDGSGLALEFSTLDRASWTAGSRQASCSVTPKPGADWKPLVGSVRQRRSGIEPPGSPPTPPPSPTSSEATAPSSTAPSATETVDTPTASSVPPPTTAAAPPPPPSGSPAEVPPPGPPAPAPPPSPAPNLVLIPGLAPITLPFPAPAPPAPAPPPPA